MGQTIDTHACCSCWCQLRMNFFLWRPRPWKHSFSLLTSINNYMQGELLSRLQNQRQESPQWSTVHSRTGGISSCSVQDARSHRTRGIRMQHCLETEGPEGPESHCCESTWEGQTKCPISLGIGRNRVPSQAQWAFWCMLTFSFFPFYSIQFMSLLDGFTHDQGQPFPSVCWPPGQ